MAKLNEGDVMEGIFAICAALIFAYGEIDKKKLNKIRKKIEPDMFTAGRFTKVITESSVDDTQDDFVVTLIVRLKARSVAGAFGKDSPHFKKGDDIGNIGKKIDTLISYSEKTFAPLVRIRNQFLTNNQTDTVEFEVLADGIEGEQSGGSVKGDVMISVKANGRPISGKSHFAFSLKSGSTTVANLSPYKGLIAMLDKFGLEYTDDEIYALNLGEGGALEYARNNNQRVLKEAMLTKMFNEFVDGLETNSGSGTKKFTEVCFDILREATFGDDFASVIDLDKTKVKFITPEAIDTLEQSALGSRDYLRAKKSGVNKVLIYWGSPSPQNSLFSFRKKFRVTGSGGLELKLYVEAEKRAYAT